MSDGALDFTTRLPNEILLSILVDFLLPNGPPENHKARVVLNSGPERARCRQLRRFSGVCKRYQAIADDVGEVVVLINGEGATPVRRREAPVRRLAIIVRDSATPAQPLPTWLVQDVRLLVFSLVRNSHRNLDLPPMCSFIPHFPVLEEMTVLSEGAGYLPSVVLEKLMLVAPSISTLRLSNVFVTSLSKYPQRLRSLQCAIAGFMDLSLLAMLASSSSSTLRHLHILPPSPPYLLDRSNRSFDAKLEYTASLLRGTLSSLTFQLSEANIEQPDRHLLNHWLPHGQNLECLDISQVILTDEILRRFPRLPRLRYLRLVRSLMCPPSTSSPVFWSWATLAAQAFRILDDQERDSDLPLLIEVKCEGTLRKYDVAQRSCRGTLERFFDARNKVGKVRGGNLRVYLEYWEDRPAWRAWPSKAS